MSYTLKDDGYSFKKIMKGRKWVGRVYKDANGIYFGKIGERFVVEGRNEIDAFEQIVARQLGFANAEALKEHNRKIRSKRRQIRNEAKFVVSEMYAGNNKPLIDLIDRAISET